MDWMWAEDPLPVSGAMSYDNWKSREPDPNQPFYDATTEPMSRCEQCWRPAYGSVPGHVFCREHFLEHQRKLIADMVAKRQQGAA